MSERPPLPVPKRLLVVCPSWLGDVVMATPTFRRLRRALPGAFIGALVRPGMDQLLAGSDFFDELHVDRARGVMGPKLVAAKVRPRKYDAAVLLTNSFSTALITRLAFIPRRIGYDRDGRGLLLTDRIQAPKRPGGRWACVPAVDYYLAVADRLLGDGKPGRRDVPARLELATTADEEREADRILSAAGWIPGESPARPLAMINPGANDPAKRWPAARFGELAAHLAREHGMFVAVNGSPAEAEVVAEVVASAKSGGAEIAALTALGTTIGSLKAIVRRASLMVTNDTGPRHIAAAFGVPTVTLYGPTDPRWTTLPRAVGGAVEAVDVVADPELPASEIADDHPGRCRVDRIETARVLGAVRGLLGASKQSVAMP